MNTKTARPAIDGKVAVYRRFAADRVVAVAKDLDQLVPAVEGFEFPPASCLLMRVADVLSDCDDPCVDALAHYLFNAHRKAKWPPNGVVPRYAERSLRVCRDRRQGAGAGGRAAKPRRTPQRGAR